MHAIIEEIDKPTSQLLPTPIAKMTTSTKNLKTYCPIKRVMPCKSLNLKTDQSMEPNISRDDEQSSKIQLEANSLLLISSASAGRQFQCGLAVVVAGSGCDILSTETP